MSGRSDFRFGTSAVATCDADGLVEGVKPFYSGNTQSSHLAIHGGFMMNVLEKVTKNKFNLLFCCKVAITIKSHHWHTFIVH